jgi:hypothetical protein
VYPIKSAALPSIILVLMGSIDCITTVIGTLYFGAVESNPIMATIVGNVPLFMALKLAATLCIAGTYGLANRILYSTQDKTTKGFRFGTVAMKAAYGGLVVFLAIVVVNNFMVLLA